MAGKAGSDKKLSTEGQSRWDCAIDNILPDHKKIQNLEEKILIAKRVAGFASYGDVIGAGSGSTALLALKELARRNRDEDLDLSFIPTSYEIEWSCHAEGVRVASLSDSFPDWCFDGADEVDPGGHLIKGRGGALYREKLVMKASRKRYILVDRSKFVEILGQVFPVPVECDPSAIRFIEKELSKLGTNKIALRLARGKDGPVITEKGNILLDVTFSAISKDLEKNLSGIPGVLESGLFWGYNPEIVCGG